MKEIHMMTSRETASSLMKFYLDSAFTYQLILLLYNEPSLNLTGITFPPSSFGYSEADISPSSQFLP